MSEGIGPSGADWRSRWQLKNPDDLVGGLVLVGIGLFAFWASADLPGMRGFAFGPGTAPRLFAGLLCTFGLVVMLMGFFTTQPEVQVPADYPPWRSVVAVLFANPVAFAAIYIVFVITLHVTDWLAGSITIEASASAAARSYARDVQQFLLVFVILNWVGLIALAFIRGASIGHRWLALLPALGAFLDLFSVLKGLPFLPVAMNVACVIVGFAVTPRSLPPGQFSLPALLDLPGLVRGPLFLTISIFVFAATVRPLGLVISTFATFVVSGMGSKETRWVECTITAVAMTTFCVLLFVYALNLPFQVWPRF